MLGRLRSAIRPGRRAHAGEMTLTGAPRIADINRTSLVRQ